MGTRKDLVSHEATSKLKELIEDAGICLFATNLNKQPLTTRPMSAQQVDDDGTIWFFSSSSSGKNSAIGEDNRIQLFYCNKGDYEFLSVYGEAEIIRDTEKAKELWTKPSKAWFPEGADDPQLTIIRVTPISAHYWDTKTSKMVSLLKIAMAAATGKAMDDGVEGELTL